MNSRVGWRRRFFALTCAAALVTSPAAAHQVQRALQGARPDGTSSAVTLGAIDGTVTDTNRVPIGAAEVVIVSTGARVQADADGRFRIRDLPGGSHILIVRRIGFYPASMIVRVVSTDTQQVSFTLQRVAQELDVVTVTGERGQSLGLLEFEYRRRYGFGRYMRREEIERSPGMRTTELLRRLGAPLAMSPPVGGQKRWHVGNPRFVMRTPTMGVGPASMAEPTRCDDRVFVNGVALPGPVDTDDLPSARELAAIEVYRGAPPPIPLHYGGLSACGSVIMLWTRNGS